MTCNLDRWQLSAVAVQATASDLDVKRVTVTPPETNPPLLIDPDAVLALEGI
jgi:hypothetical protein